MKAVGLGLEVEVTAEVFGPSQLRALTLPKVSVSTQSGPAEETALRDEVMKAVGEDPGVVMTIEVLEASQWRARKLAVAFMSIQAGSELKLAVEVRLLDADLGTVENSWEVDLTEVNEVKEAARLVLLDCTRVAKMGNVKTVGRGVFETR